MYDLHPTNFFAAGISRFPTLNKNAKKNKSPFVRHNT